MDERRPRAAAQPLTAKPGSGKFLHYN